MSIGRSEISNLPESDDIMSTIRILRNLGIEIKKIEKKWIVNGNGTNGYLQPQSELNCQNSGTSARILIAAVSVNPIYCTFIGDKSLNKRPMSRITDYLKKIGADISLTNNNYLPLSVSGAHTPLPLLHKISKPSAQVKTGLIFAALQISGETTICETRKTRDHTELLLDYFKVNYKRKSYAKKGQKIIISGPQEIKSKKIFIGGDPSSAAFFVVAALIVKGSEITLKDVVLNKTRILYLSILKKMGGKIKVQKTKIKSGEQLGSITIASSPLRSISIPSSLSPYLIDEYPILSVAASCARGTTVMNGLTELKYKESNRIKSIQLNLRKLKVKCTVKNDNLRIKGLAGNPLGGVTIKTFGDHRIAMSFKILNLVCDKKLKFDNIDCINVSYPKFTKDLETLVSK